MYSVLFSNLPMIFYGSYELSILNKSMKALQFFYPFKQWRNLSVIISYRWQPLTIRWQNVIAITASSVEHLLHPALASAAAAAAVSASASASAMALASVLVPANLKVLNHQTCSFYGFFIQRLVCLF